MRSYVNVNVLFEFRRPKHIDVGIRMQSVKGLKYTYICLYSRTCSKDRLHIKTTCL